MTNVLTRAAVAIFAGLFACAPALCDPNGTLQALNGTCISNNRDATGLTTECVGPQAVPDLRFISAGPQYTYAVTVTASPGHCSDVSWVIMTYDLSRPLGVTGLLQPGQSKTVSLGNGYAAGLQIAKVKAYGWVSDTGCNRGFLKSWSATAVVNQR